MLGLLRGTNLSKTVDGIPKRLSFLPVRVHGLNAPPAPPGCGYTGKCTHRIKPKEEHIQNTSLPETFERRQEKQEEAPSYTLDGFATTGREWFYGK